MIRFADEYDVESTPPNYWEKSPGYYIAIADMTTVHIKNCVKWILRKTQEFVEKGGFISGDRMLGSYTGKYAELVSELNKRRALAPEFINLCDSYFQESYYEHHNSTHSDDNGDPGCFADDGDYRNRFEGPDVFEVSPKSEF